MSIILRENTLQKFPQKFLVSREEIHFFLFPREESKTEENAMCSLNLSLSSKSEFQICTRTPQKVWSSNMVQPNTGWTPNKIWKKWASTHSKLYVFLQIHQNDPTSNFWTWFDPTLVYIGRYICDMYVPKKCRSSIKLMIFLSIVCSLVMGLSLDRPEGFPFFGGLWLDILRSVQAESRLDPGSSLSFKARVHFLRLDPSLLFFTLFNTYLKNNSKRLFIYCVLTFIV